MIVIINTQSDMYYLWCLHNLKKIKELLWYD